MIKKNTWAYISISILYLCLLNACSQNGVPSSNGPSSLNASSVMLVSMNDTMTIGNYVLVSKVRSGRTTFDYTYNASITNNGAIDVKDVTASLTSLVSSTAVISGSLSFGDVPAGSTLASNNTFTVRIDRSLIFDQNNLQWEIQATASISEEVDSEGGEIQFPDGAKVIVDDGIFQDNSIVTIDKYELPLDILSEASIESNTYQITIFASDLMQEFSDGEDINKFITLEIPVLPSDEDTSDDYKVARVVFDNGLEELSMYGSYSTSDPNAPASFSAISWSSLLKAYVNISKSVIWMNLIPEEIGSLINIYTIAVTIYSLNDNSEQIDSNFYKVNSPTSITKVDTVQSSVINPIILIHGLQLTNDGPDRQPQMDTWSNFISYLYNREQTDITNNLYTYRYNTRKSLDYNAQMLRDEIRDCFPEIICPNIIIIGHSMGGLIAHVYIQKYDGEQRVLKLITVGTPYHGSPCITDDGVVNAFDAYLAIKAKGTQDLKWDNYDDNAYGLRRPGRSNSIHRS